ncbi:DUF1266 domain-containing protein [Candidatus Enterococcus ferrettii]|uniref:Uncharacterized protein n=1 Tax=Candidatus Enterococcus ferrettii TaxID=2815324 RepID=A0ABV0ETT0_9ENTE|nr:DUF1266 domain-containing protein [Enterococcus sp. 665A]MBO1342266.1 DUF1266 domain-containing protein [Enterococcus sp. 665A]
MFKIIKEYIINPFKEGREEARKEAEQEKQEQNQITEDTITDLTYTEMFAACLAAPFRASIFLDWFSLFKKEEVDSEEQPILHLLCFGEIANLKKEDIRSLKVQQETSFNISSGEEALIVAKASLQAADIQLLSFQEVSDSSEAAHPKVNFVASEIEIAAIVLVSAVDTNLLQKEQVLAIFEELIPKVQEQFEGWEDYGTQLLDQDTIMKFDTGISRKLLEETMENLIHRGNSPWQYVKWTL